MHMEKSRNQFKKIKNILSEEFKNRCAFCGTKLDSINLAVIEHFYPVSLYPEKAGEVDNLFLSCSDCNWYKGGNFPISDDKSPLLLNPRLDKTEDHIRIDKSGSALFVTERGKITIEILNLNRPSLVEERRVRIIEDELIESYRKTNKEYYNTFRDNLEKIRGLTKFSELAKDDINIHLLNMLYSNVITSLETYLSDAFINTVRSDMQYLRKFVESFHNFKKEKFELAELFNYHDIIEEKSITTMADVIYHDLPKVKGMYNDTLGIIFPEFSVIYKAVLKRHDFVHRNGKTKDGKKHEINQADIESLCVETEIFVKSINEQILALRNKQV